MSTALQPRKGPRKKLGVRSLDATDGVLKVGNSQSPPRLTLTHRNPRVLRRARSSRTGRGARRRVLQFSFVLLELGYGGAAIHFCIVTQGPGNYLAEILNGLLKGKQRGHECALLMAPQVIREDGFWVWGVIIW